MATKTTATQCKQCHRTEERRGSKVRRIQLNRAGLCGACVDANAEMSPARKSRKAMTMTHSRVMELMQSFFNGDDVNDLIRRVDTVGDQSLTHSQLRVTMQDGSRWVIGCSKEATPEWRRNETADTVHDKVDDAKAQQIADATSGAYSYDTFKKGQWLESVKMMMRAGMTDREIEAVLRSKHTRWAGDRVSRSSNLTARELADYLDTVTGLDLDQLVQETFDGL